MRRSFIREEEEVPRRRRVAFVFSMGRGSVFARARFERAFLGLLGDVKWENQLSSVNMEASLQVLTFVAALWKMAVSLFEALRTVRQNFSVLGYLILLAGPP